jgi:hypothetical protein
MQAAPWDVEHTSAIVAVEMVVVMIGASARLIPIGQPGKRNWHERAFVKQRFKSSINSGQAYRL